MGPLPRPLRHPRAWRGARCEQMLSKCWWAALSLCHASICLSSVYHLPTYRSSVNHRSSMHTPEMKTRAFSICRSVTCFPLTIGHGHRKHESAVPPFLLPAPHCIVLMCRRLFNRPSLGQVSIAVDDAAVNTPVCGLWGASMTIPSELILGIGRAGSKSMYLKKMASAF